MARARAVIVAAGMLVAGCPSVDPYACGNDSQCVLGGAQGICADDRCAYQDGECASGFRYPDDTDRGLANECVPGLDTGSTSGTTLSGTSVDPATTAEPESSSTSVDTSSSSGEPTCMLEESPPLSFMGERGLVVERLVIDANASAAVRITDCPGVIVRDLEIRFAGSPGIVVENSPDAVIERVSLTNSAAPKSGPAAAGEIGLHVVDSPRVQIRDVFVTDARSGIQVLASDDALVEDFVVHNARSESQTGNDSGGDCVLVQTGANAIVRRFGCTNDPVGVNAHAGIFVDRAPGTRVEDGVADNVVSGSDAGVRVHTPDGTGGIVVQGVDVVGGTHACFDIVWGDDVTLVDTGCRNNAGVGWAGSEVIGEVRVQQGRYYNLGEGTQCCGDAFVEFDVMLDQFVARLPPDVAAPCSVL